MRLEYILFLGFLPICFVWVCVLLYCVGGLAELVNPIDFSVEDNETDEEDDGDEEKDEVVKGLSATYLEKLPKITGKDLVMGTDCCAVCLEEVESDQQARLIPGCNHGFHLHCADAWLVINAVCPMCRAEIGPQFFDSTETNPC